MFLRMVFPVVILLVGVVSAVADVVWRDASTLTVEGRGWEVADAPFQRLPNHAKATVPAHVWDLGRSSAGITIRFRTQADRIEARWDLTSASLAMPHMPATGVSGLDLYVRDGSSRTWHFVQNGRPTGQLTNTVQFRVGSNTVAREYLLYLPLYNGVSRLDLGVDSTFRIEAVPPGDPSASRRPIVLYGTSIVQGGCASRPGLAWPAILGRQLDRPVINLGFSGAGHMEPAVVDVIAELDPALFVIDCLWNIGDQGSPEIEARVTHLATTLRRLRPTTPILFVGQSDIRNERHPTGATQAQERAIRMLQSRNLAGLHLVGGSLLLGFDREGTVDGVHPNDLGMMRHADALGPVVEGLLRR
jgi:lysophospholipase L1-like esterase